LLPVSSPSVIDDHFTPDLTLQLLVRGQIDGVEQNHSCLILLGRHRAG
jgi:hypothetical protein